MLGKIEGRRRRGDWRWCGWMASLTQWTWRWWRTGKPGVLQFTESQRIRHNLATEQRQQISQDETNSLVKVLKKNQSCIFAQKLVMISVCSLGSYVGTPKTAIWSLSCGVSALPGTFPTGTPHGCDSGLPIILFSSGCWSTQFGDVCAVPLLYCFYFPFLFMTAYWN